MDTAPTTPPSTRQQRLRHGWRRVVRLVRWILLGVAGLLLVLLLVLALPTGRQFLLHTGLDLVAGHLAGGDPASELTVGEAKWRRLGELSLGDVVWTAGPDTLARIEALHLELDLGDLWRRDLTVVLAEARGLSADLPAIEAHLPTTAALDTTGTADASASAAGPVAVPFLRNGSWPAFPSLAVEQLTLARVAVTTAPGLTAHLDTLDLALELRHGRRPQIAAGLRARPLSTLGVSWRLAGTVDGDTLDLALAPLHLAAPARLPAESALPLDGRLRLPSALVDSLLAGRFVWPSFRIEQLMVAGDAGTWRLDAQVAGRSPGRLTLRSELPEAPVALLAGLATLSQDTTLTRARLDLLAARWSEHGRPGVDLVLDITPPPPSAALEQARVQAQGRIRLPAPAAIAPLLPPQLQVADLGPIDLDLAATYDGTAEVAAFTLDLDLGRTAWLDQAEAHLAGDLGAIDQAGLDLRLPGLALVASGRADADSLQFDLGLDVPDATLLQRWRDPLLADLALETSLRLQAAGPWLQPRAGLELTAAAESPQFHLPRAEVTGTLAGEAVGLHAVLPSGLQVLDHAVTGLDLDFQGSLTDSLRHLRGRLEFAAQAPPASLALRGELDLQDPATDLNLAFTGDHLAITLDRRSLTSTRPWRLAFTAADTTAQLDGLRLAGSLGHLDLHGRSTPGHLDAGLDLELRLLLDALRPLLPEAARAQLPAGSLNIVGQGQAAGPPAALWADGSLRVAILELTETDGLPDLTDLAGLAAHLDASLGGQGSPPSSLSPGSLVRQAGRVRLQGSLLDRETTLASLTASLPWPLTGSDSDSLGLHLAAPAFDLGRLAPLLPPDLEVGGHLSIDTHVQGRLPTGLTSLDSLQTLDPVRDLDLVLAGDLDLQDLSLRLTGDTQVLLAGGLDLQGTSQSPLVTADLALSGDLGQARLEASAGTDSLTAAIDLDLTLASETLRPYLLPEQQALLPRGSLTVRGVVQAAGSITAPWAAGDLELRVIDQPDAATLTSTVDLLVGGRGAVPGRLESDQRAWRAESLRLRLRLLDQGTELLRLSALAPLPHLAAAPDSVDMRLSADALDLARLAPLLPAGTTLSGRFDAATRMSGQMLPGQQDADLDLDGRLSVADLRLQLPEGSRLALRGQVDLAGTSLAPQIRGGLHIEGGLLRLPDPPPTLLPATGEALLWHASPGETATAGQAVAGSQATLAPAPVDTAATQPAGQATPAASPREAAPAGPAMPVTLPELVFNVTSPGGLWLRGQGLDVELAGDLSLILRAGQLAIEGELQAVQGTMRQLGHIFRLQRGRIIFDGSETELNPELDLALGVRVGEYQISILLGGTALVPSLRFSSEPELSEGDILATLLFGKPLDELDEGQTGLLASRAAQIAAAYGSARLQESLARQLGVDVVSIAPREGDEETTALTIGKYLSPRVMVRYEQLLREGSAFFVHLDYRFAGAFRLHTQVSQGEESGLQLKWQQDW